MTVASLRGFQDLDALIVERGMSMRTLDPQRTRALAFVDIAEALDLRRREPGLVDALAALATGLVTAVATHFPENIFADYAAILEACLDEAERSENPRETLDETAQILVELQALFGCASPVRFRYVHDFLYGYDWVKWVQRDPGARAAVGPYDMVFLRYMLQRGRELLALIAHNDTTYPQLRDASARNPFRFDRNPPAEIAIHERLAERDEVPVRAYRVRASGDPCNAWSLPFQDLRVSVAESLGFMKP